MYALIKADEDGNPLYIVDDINEVLDSPEDYGIERFLDEWPEEKDPQYWTEGNALLVKIEILKPKVAVTKYVL